MKIRSGFVSNSSSSSFCIYGWVCKTTDELYALKDRIEKCKKDSNIDIIITHSNNNVGEEVIGVGNTNTDMDHYMEDWENYECNPPTDKETKALKRIGKKLKLPPPQLYNETFYN